ncbi:MAG: hypothetical protein GTO17_04340 [Candidatus Aminicenantes bacterium]|nr:hypothetical protein [Candidatus Aminicenantes bacterium]
MRAENVQNVLFKVGRFAVIALILAGNACHSIAQEVPNPIIIGDSMSINSTILNEKRDIFIYRPQDYDQENKKFEDAVDIIDYFASRHSESFSGLSPHFVQAGNELMENKRYECAIKLFELITGTNDKIFGAFKGLGDAYYAIEKKGAALQNYKRALKLRPNDQYIKEQINKLRK